MSIAYCPIPDANYKELSSNLGEYQAGRVLESYSRLGNPVPEVGSSELKRMIEFWKNRYGYQNENPSNAKNRILKLYGKPGTKSLVHPQWYAKMTNAVTDYNKMKGQRLLGFFNINNGGDSKLYIVKEENQDEFMPDFNEGSNDSQVENIFPVNSELGNARFTVLSTTYYNKRRDYQRQLVELRQRRKEVSDPLRKATISDSIERIKDRIDETEADIKILEAEKAVEAIIPFATKDFDEISTFINENSLENPELVDFKQMEFARKLINTWLSVANVTNPDHPFLDQFEIQSEEVHKYLDSIYNKAQKLNFTLEKIALKKVVNSTGTYLGRKIEETELFKPIRDTGEWTSNTLALQRMEPTLLQAIGMKIKDVEFMSVSDYKTRELKFDAILNKAMPDLLKLNKQNPFNIFKQITQDGYETGSMVFRYSQDFYDHQNRLYRFAKQSEDAEERKMNFKKLFDWQKDNMIFIDPRKLSDPEYLKNLEFHYGTRGVDELLKRVRDKDQEFKEDYESAKLLFERDNEGSEINEKLDIFNKKYNPEIYLQNIEEKTLFTVGGETVYPTTKYVVSIPKRVNDNGDYTNHYDEKYNTISENDNIYELHNAIIDMLSEYKRYIPYELSNELQINSIPSLSKTMFETFGEEGFIETGKSLYDQFLNSNLVSRTSDITYQSVDPLTNAIDPSLNFKMNFDTDRVLNQRIKERLIPYRASGEEIISELLSTIYKEERHKLSQEKSWDIGKIMKVYSFAAIQYKHKARVEDLLMWQKRMFESRTSEIDYGFGKAKIVANSTSTLEPDGVSVKESGAQLVNYKKTLDHTMNAFLGMPIRDVEGKTDTTFYDSEDLKRKKELESQLRVAEMGYEAGEMSEEEYSKLKTDIQDSIDRLGGDFTWSKFGDNVLQYFQIKGMGWNVFAGLTNVGFGMISNMLLAADGREFGEKEFWQSMRISFASISNNFTFNQTQKINTDLFKDSVKLRSLMDRNNIMKEASQEMFKRSTGDKALTNSSNLAKRLKFLNPYNPQMRSEYLVQSMVLASMMKSKKNYVTDLKGESRLLWEAFTQEGNWNFEEFGIQPEWEYSGEKMLNFLRRVDSTITEAHGDYSNPLLVKKTLWKRAFSQFRTWMFEGFANRFEEEKFDENRGYTRKGRYRSFDKGSSVIAGALAGTAIAPGIGSLAGAGLAYGASKFFGESTEFKSDIQSILFNLKQLFRRLLIAQRVGNMDLSLQYNEDTGFSEVDAANMRKNMSELAIYIYLYSFGLVLKSGLDDQEENAKLVYNFLINQGNRLETDILFYTNPMELRTLMKQIIPALSLVEDAAKWFDAVNRQFDGRPDMMSGPFEGENILLRRSLENIPLGTQYYRLRKNAEYVMDL